MDSLKQSRGVGPPDSRGIVALQPKMVLSGEREGAVATALAAAAGLRCKAFVLLAICLSVIALPYSMGTLAALPWALPPPSPTALGSTASQQGTGDDVAITHEDLPKGPAVQPCGRVLIGSGGTLDFFPGAERDVTCGTDAEGWSLETLTAAAASSVTAQTSPQWQRGPSHGERFRLSTAVAVTQWLGTGVLATSPQLLQTMGDPSSGPQHPLALGSLHGTGVGLPDAVQVPAVTSGDGLGQPEGPEPQGLGVHSPSDAPAYTGTLVGSLSQSSSTADHPRGYHVLALEAAPDHQNMPCSADLSLVSSKPLAVVTAIDLSSGARAVTAGQSPSRVPAPDQPTASGSSDVQHGAPVAGATSKRCNEQKEAVRPSPGLPDLGMSEDHTATPHIMTLPDVPSALPTFRTSSSTKMYPDTAQVLSAVTPAMLWDTRPAGTFLPKAALLVNTVLPKVLGNRSGLLATVLASLPSAALAHDVDHPQVLAPSLSTAGAGGSAVTLGTLSDLSSPTQQTLPSSTKAHPSPAQTRAPSVAALGVTGVNSAAPDAIPEPGVTKGPCKDGAAIMASPSPRAAGATHGSPLMSASQRPPLHLDPFFKRASEDGVTAGQYQDMKVAEMSVLPGQAREAGHGEPRTASVGPTAAPAGPPGPTHRSSGSASLTSSTNPSPEHCSKAVHRTGTANLPTPSSLLPSTGAVRAATSQTLTAHAAVTFEAQSMSSPSITSQRLSTAREYLPELMTMGKPGSTGVKPPASLSPSQPVHVLPLQFRLVGIAYTKALSSRASESYRVLEEEVKLMLKQMLSTYETFLWANVLEFMNGSVVVLGEVLFRGDTPAPTNSHLIRTVVTEASSRRSIFSWQLEPQSVQSSGFSLENLDPEKLSISLTAFQLGKDRTDSMKRLISEVTWSLSTLYPVRNFTIVQLRNLSGEVDITGDIYLDTIAHADVAEVLQALTALSNCSVDLTSLSVEGARLDLQVYPISFLIINRHFSENLLDPLAIEHQDLTRHLGDVVSTALRDHGSFLQVVIRGFLPGSLICHGDVVFQHPAPTSLEVLEALLLSVGPNKALAGSDFEVDPYSLAVGEVTLEPPQPEPGFPEYGVAIMVVCSLCIITAPIVLLVCLRIKRLGWWDRMVFWDRRDPEAGTQTLEMDNQGFWVSSQQGLEDARVHWQSDSA